MRKQVILLIIAILLILPSVVQPPEMLAMIWSEDIEGYASAESINKGESIDFHVSTNAATYHIDIYRIGWYGGMGGEWIFGVKDLTGTNYGAPAPDPTTGMIEANWPVAYTLSTDSSWESGYYVARLTPNTGDVGNFPFIIRDDSSTADIMYVPPFTTYQAYNAWGGKSIYDSNSTGANAYGDTRAYKISFNRPYDLRDGLKYLFDGDFQMIRWLEREGYDVTYASSVDLHTNPNLFDNHKMFLSNYHDEYYTWEMRENVVNARDAGVDLAYFTSNNIYWQMRYESSPSTLDANRVITCYKSETFGHGLPYDTLDPYATSSDPEEVKLTTVQWRQAPVNLPENEVLGVMYEGDFGDTIYYDWIVDNASHWVYNGTGLNNGDTIPAIIGDEYDRRFANGFEPAGVVQLSNSPIPATGGTQNASIYQAASGAWVFDASTNSWALKLLDTEYDTVLAADVNVEIITRNLLNTMIGEPQPTPWSGEAVIFDENLTFDWLNNGSPADFWEESIVFPGGTRSMRVDMSNDPPSSNRRLSVRNKNLMDATPYSYFQLSIRPTVTNQFLSAYFWYNETSPTNTVNLHSFTGSPGYAPVGSWTTYCIPLSEFVTDPDPIPDNIHYFWLRGASGTYGTVYVDNVKFTFNNDDCDPNTTPTTSGIADVTVNEDATDTVIDLTTSFEDVEDSDADLVYSVTGNTDSGLVTTTVDNVADTLTLSYTADDNGSADITVQAMDTGGKSVDTTFTVTVDPVNDKPAFTSLGNQSVPFGTDTEQTVAGWASNFDFGPADEDAVQAVLDFQISVTSGGSLFTMAPDVDNTGTLTFTPTGTAGTANVEVRLQDDGGTTNGGVDLSDVTVIEITINANSTPTTSGISDVTVNEDETDTVIDLTAAFDDIEDADADLVYAVTGNTDSSLVTTSVDNTADTLTLSYTADDHGSADITVEATDSGGLSVDTTFTVTVNSVNDKPGFSSLGNQSILFGTDTEQTVAGWASNFDFGPADEDIAQSVLDFQVSVTSGGSMFTVAPDVENSGVLTYTPTGVAGTATIEVRLQDNGGIANGGIDLSDVTVLEITVNANSTPTTSGIGDVTVNEDATDTVIDLTAAFDDIEDSDADLVYAVTGNTNTSLVTTSVDNVADTLTLSYAADDHGDANITVEATDRGGLSVDTTFLVTVNPVNDKPGFTSLGNQSVPFGTNTVQTVVGWASGFDYGPADEDGTQAVLDFQISVTSGGSLFTVAPDVANNGTLTYTPTGASGTANVEVRLRDNGGTANGGVDLSNVTILQITINANTPPTTTGIADVSVNQNALDTVIDLTASFADAEDADADLVYAVTGNTNAGLITTSVDNVADTLTLSYATNSHGSANITVQATDSGGLDVDATFLVTVNPTAEASISEQELQLRLNTEIISNPVVQEIEFVVVDLVPNGFELTVRIVEGTVGDATVAVVGSNFLTLRITEITVDGENPPDHYADAINRELLPLLVGTLNGLFDDKVGPGRDLSSFTVTDTLIEAIFLR